MIRETVADRQVSWTSKTGVAITITITLYRDEYGPRVGMSLQVDGRGESSLGRVDVLDVPRGDLVASIGRVGLTAERLAAVRAAEAELAPQYAALTATYEAALAAHRAHDQHVASVERSL